MIKCTVAGAPIDYSIRRVLLNPLKGGPSTDQRCVHGVAKRTWVLKQWTRSMTLTIKGKTDTHLYKRPYIEHTLTGDIITVQHKAWNDTVGTAMWVDVQVDPKQRNCGSTCRFRRVGHPYAAQLPPRTTSILQGPHRRRPREGRHP
jgi:hypothetical protein